MKVRKILDTIYCYKSCSFYEICEDGNPTISEVTFIDIINAEHLHPEDAERFENFDMLTKLREILEKEYVCMSLMFDEKLSIIYK